MFFFLHPLFVFFQIFSASSFIHFKRNRFRWNEHIFYNKYNFLFRSKYIFLLFISEKYFSRSASLNIAHVVCLHTRLLHFLQCFDLKFSSFVLFFFLLFFFPFAIYFNWYLLFASMHLMHGQQQQQYEENDISEPIRNGKHLKWALPKNDVYTTAVACCCCWFSSIFFFFFDSVTRIIGCQFGLVKMACQLKTAFQFCFHSFFFFCWNANSNFWFRNHFMVKAVITFT